MKLLSAASLVFVLSAMLLRAQYAQPAVEPTSEPATTNAIPAEALTTAEQGTNEPVKLDMEAMSEWTNSVGMVLLKVGDGLWAGKYEVTQKEYSEVAGGNPSSFAGENRPVDSVNWNDAKAFGSKLTQLDQEKELLPEGYGYALPTEKQWETLVNGATLENSVTSQAMSRSGTEQVGSKGANSLGLHDTRGNVMEWVLDGFNPDYNYRILRGGAWNTSFDVNLRINFRHYAPPTEAKNEYGFRVVLVKEVSDRSAEE